MSARCPICGLVLDQGRECPEGHRRTSEAFRLALTNSILALRETATQLRQIALRLDSRGDTTAKQIHEQARQVELRARRITLLLEAQPRWPENRPEG
jgi:hypothetical protein